MCLDCKLIYSGSNVSAYINMVCDTLRISLPKAVVYCQVREAKRSLLNFFYAQVGRKEVNNIDYPFILKSGEHFVMIPIK